MLVKLFIMLKRFSWIIVFAGFCFNGCGDIRLLTKDKVHAIVSTNEMKEVYSSHASVFDSIALMGFQLYDMLLMRQHRITQVTICDQNIQLGREGSAGFEKDLTEIYRLAEADAEFKNLKESIREYKSGLRVPHCNDIYADNVKIPYKRVKETLKDVYYKSFIYYRGDGNKIGDSIFQSIRTY